MMTKTEREHLRQLIRAQFKLLRTDVAKRKAELLTELDADLRARYAEQDKRWDDTRFQIRQVVDEANRKVNDLYRDLLGREQWGERHDRQVVTAAAVGQPKHERAELRRQGITAIDAKVADALYELERREVQLLAELATTALQSAEAQRFMGQIPKVAELVPAARVLAALDHGDQEA